MSELQEYIIKLRDADKVLYAETQHCNDASEIDLCSPTMRAAKAICAPCELVICLVTTISKGFINNKES